MLVITDRALLVATKTTEAQKLLDGLAGFLRHRNRPLKLVLKDSCVYQLSRKRSVTEYRETFIKFSDT